MLTDLRVPDFSNVHLPGLLEKVGTNEKPLKVKVVSDSSATPNNCFPNVRARVEKYGGQLIHGWSIWISDFLIEAEFHGVWQNNDRELIDITPKLYSEILFVIDGSKVYGNRQVDNIRINISGQGLVDDL